MPIYEYQCNNCDHHFDVMQKISDAPVTQCPECAKNTVVKLVSPAGFQLKGTGWYVTDFKNKNSKVSSKDAASTEAASTKSEGATTEKTTKTTESSN